MTARRAPRTAWSLSIGISALLGDDSLDSQEVVDEVGAGEVAVRDPAVTLNTPLGRPDVTDEEHPALIVIPDGHLTPV